MENASCRKKGSRQIKVIKLKYATYQHSTFNTYVDRLKSFWPNYSVKVTTQNGCCGYS